MAEPSTSAGVTLTVIAVTLLGPLAGPYALIAFAALAGALWPLSAAHTDTLDGAWLLLRCTLTAIILTVFLARAIEHHLGVPAFELFGPLGLLIGALGNGWRSVFEAVSSALRALVTRAGGGR